MSLMHVALFVCEEEVIDLCVEVAKQRGVGISGLVINEKFKEEVQKVWDEQDRDELFFMRSHQAYNLIRDTSSECRCWLGENHIEGTNIRESD